MSATGQPVRLLYNGQMVDGEELAFEPLRETWNEYRCADGSLLRLRLVVSRIVKIVSERNTMGEPVYQVLSTNVVAVQPAAEDMA